MRAIKIRAIKQSLKTKIAANSLFVFADDVREYTKQGKSTINKPNSYRALYQAEKKLFK